MQEVMHIQAVAFETDGTWFVHGVNHHIVARAGSLNDVPKAFIKILNERLAVAKHLGLDPFEGVGPAPKLYRDMFDRARNELRPVA